MVVGPLLARREVHPKLEEEASLEQNHRLPYLSAAVEMRMAVLMLPQLGLSAAPLAPALGAAWGLWQTAGWAVTVPPYSLAFARQANAQLACHAAPPLYLS